MLSALQSWLTHVANVKILPQSVHLAMVGSLATQASHSLYASSFNQDCTKEHFLLGMASIHSIDVEEIREKVFIC